MPADLFIDVMIYRNSDSNRFKPMDGIIRRMIACGDRSQIIEFVMEKGASIPLHQHPNDQVGFVVKGCIRLYIDGEGSELKDGDGYSIGADVPHRVEVLEDTIAVDVFSPPREDYKK